VAAAIRGGGAHPAGCRRRRGESAGAYLSSFLSLDADDAELDGTLGVVGVPSAIQAAVAWYPPTQFLTMDEQAPADAFQRHDAPDSPESVLIGGALQENPADAAYASPVSHARHGSARLLLVHGLRDRLVPYQQSVALKEALDAAGADVRLELVESADHVFERVDHGPLITASADFLAEKLA